MHAANLPEGQLTTTTAPTDFEGNELLPLLLPSSLVGCRGPERAASVAANADAKESFRSGDGIYVARSKEATKMLFFKSALLSASIWLFFCCKAST